MVWWELGVIIWEKQKFSLQVIWKTNGHLAFITRGMENRSMEILLQLWWVLVVSEYCFQFWIPCMRKLCSIGRVPEVHWVEIWRLYCEEILRSMDIYYLFWASDPEIYSEVFLEGGGQFLFPLGHSPILETIVRRKGFTFKTFQKLWIFGILSSRVLNAGLLNTLKTVMDVCFGWQGNQG